jgi:hypothetical protein
MLRRASLEGDERLKGVVAASVAGGGKQKQLVKVITKSLFGIPSPVLGPQQSPPAVVSSDSSSQTPPTPPLFFSHFQSHTQTQAQAQAQAQATSSEEAVVIPPTAGAVAAGTAVAAGVCV